MEEISQSLFDIYALSLPRGLAFGKAPPVRGWTSSDKLSCGVITLNEDDGTSGLLVIRRRVDGVWTVTEESGGISSFEEARERLKPLLKEGKAKEPLPLNTAARPALHDLEGREASEIFQLLSQPSHHVAAWLLNQLYLSLPNPDPNWASDCQTANFHTRLWEAQLLASFREQGLLVTQPHVSPDFRVENRLGGVAWIEAVTANPPEAYNHVNAPLSEPPKDREERFIGSAAVRFAKTLGSKYQREYHSLPHVSGFPFLIALADFHAPASMVWSREALHCYLYGMIPVVKNVEGIDTAFEKPVSRLLGKSEFPAGMFCDDTYSDISGIIFSNACSISKLNRVGISAGATSKGLRYVRIGEFFDRSPRALKGIPFCLDVTSDEYRALWPQGYEPWTAELEVLHNPFAKYPTPHELFPEATHWFEHNGEIVCKSFYETSILYSRTLIQNEKEAMPTLDNIL